jgi:hypothetical protein
MEKEENTLGNMKCSCMRYVPGDYIANCRNCGLPPNQKSFNYETYVDDFIGNDKLKTNFGEVPRK